MTRRTHRSGSDTSRTSVRPRCPHCNAVSRIRSSRAITPIYAELRFECGNDACGHIWVAALHVLRTLVPSELPNPDIQIPLSARVASGGTALAVRAASVAG